MKDYHTKMILSNIQFLGFQGCSKYFPSDAGENQTHGSFNVNCQSITVDNTDFVERKLQLTTTDDPSASKELTHLQFKTWPNYGVPEGSTAIARFIDHVRQTCIKRYVFSPLPQLNFCLPPEGQEVVHLVVLVLLLLVGIISFFFD